VDPDDVLRQTPGWAIEEIDGELLLFRALDSQMLHCNPTASMLFELCDGERSVGDIVATLSAAYPDQATAIPAQVRNTLQLLVTAGALSDGATPSEAGTDPAAS